LMRSVASCALIRRRWWSWSFLSSRASCCTSVLKIQGRPHAYHFSIHGRRRQSIFILAILQFFCSESLYLACKTF
jgi:hypothetical protein